MNTPPFVVGIRFQKTGKIYHFDASSATTIQVGDFAVVETSRGRQLGEVITLVSLIGGGVILLGVWMVQKS